MGRHAGKLRLLDRSAPSALDALYMAIPPLGWEDELRTVGSLMLLNSATAAPPSRRD